MAATSYAAFLFFTDRERSSRQVSFLDRALRGGVAVVGQVEVRDLPRRRTRWPGGSPLWRWGTRIATRVSWAAGVCGRSRSSTMPYEGRSAGLQQSMAGLVPRPALRGGVAVVGQVEVRDLPRRRTRWPGGSPLWRWGTRIATRVSWAAGVCGRSRSSTVPYEGRRIWWVVWVNLLTRRDCVACYGQGGG